MGSEQDAQCSEQDAQCSEQDAHTTSSLYFWVRVRQATQ